MYLACVIKPLHPLTVLILLIYFQNGMKKCNSYFVWTYECDYMKDGVIGGACSTNGRDGKYVQNLGWKSCKHETAWETLENENYIWMVQNGGQ
jgi:hypothetical protein